MYIEISNPMEYRVALYIRLSKEDESEGPSESVTNQKSLLNDFVKKNRLNVYDTYVDDGWSGTNFERPEFQRMIGDIENGRVNMVITKDLSRLGRDYILTGHYMERYFPEHRVRYISLLDGIDTGIESTANDITPFRAIMNDMYAKDISKKIKSVKQDKQRKGQFIGGKPAYGYKMHPKEKNKIVIDEETAPTVRYIFQLALEGISCRQIAVKLNDEGVPTPATHAGINLTRKGPYSGLWSSERVSFMLQNEVYIGNMVQGRVAKINYKSKKCIKKAKENWVVVEGTHEPIIDKDVFLKVRELIKSRNHTRSRTHDFLLKGMIFCHECGYPLTVINRKNADGSDTLYFMCRTYQRFTKSGACTSHCIKENVITQAVLSKIDEVCKSFINSRELLPVAQKVIKIADETAQTESEICELKSKISLLIANLDKMYMDRLNGILADSDFERIYKQVKNERASLEEKIKDLEKYAEDLPSMEERAEKLVKKFVGSALANRELLVSLVERIELTKDRKIIIKFRFRELEAIS